MKKDVIEVIINITSIVANIVTIILPIIGLRTNIRLETKMERKQSELKNIACALEMTTNKTKIKKQIALLKNCLEHRGVFEQKNSRNDKYIWNQIGAVENCDKSDRKKEIKHLVEIIHVKIYELQERQKVEKNKKVLFYWLLVGEILALLTGLFVQKTFDDGVRDKGISLMFFYYNVLPVALGTWICLIRQLKKRIFKIGCYILLVIVFIVMTGSVFYINDKMVNIFAALSFGIIVTTVMEILDFSEYDKIMDNITNFINTDTDS